MMVTFVSQCEKNALKKTRRVLDAFANRIGDNTWQTIITQEGLDAVRKLLRHTASKSTAVSCHWIRTRARSEFIWVVGNRDKFNSEGYVPVNSTKKNLLKAYYENDWKYLPLIKALSAVSALFHDWGKASSLFQEKLKPNSKYNTKGDPIRHEWISCLLLDAFISQYNNDEAWLESLISKDINEQSLKELVQKENRSPLKDLPSAAKLVSWLIISHHRLPAFSTNKKELLDEYQGEPALNIEDILRIIKKEWGYTNKKDEDTYNKRVKECFNFPNGLLNNASKWQKELKKWAKRLHDTLPLVEECLSDGSYRIVLHHARLCLMLGDHFYSSQDKDVNWKDITGLFANTDKNKSLKQRLDEHLVGVAKNTLKTAHLLPMFEKEPPTAQDIRCLKKSSPIEYAWQDKAVKTILPIFKETEKQGFFAVNMASTGCGKTIANAKIMQAVSKDANNLRYVLALGLRTLTLQTGDEYKNRIGLDDSELAVLIGSSAISKLHNENSIEEVNISESFGSESMENLLDEDVLFDSDIPEEGLATVLKSQRDRKFLYAPVLVCTIDHLMASVDTKKGGKYILPSLRMMSSDLVIDEIDDFTGSDLIAIGRLVYLAAMLGRKVMISSATIPPDLAEGYFNVYQKGWELFTKTREVKNTIHCAWIDEFSTKIEKVNSVADYEVFHDKFIDKRIKNLEAQEIKRKVELVYCKDEMLEEYDDEATKQSIYFSKIKEAIDAKHTKFHTIDEQTGIKVSFGVVRVANIQPCIALTKHLLSCNATLDAEVKVMAYHSQQVLLMRHIQEKHLDEVLKRKEKEGKLPDAFKNSIIRHHLNNSKAKNIIFILVATPVEEVGRDHDFDWAVIEPSSFRSIVQLAGRVKRHRSGNIETPNIALMQYNYKAFKHSDEKGKYFQRPGYEVNKTLATHDVEQLLDIKSLQAKLDASLRIKKPKKLKEKTSLVDLEHYMTQKDLTNYESQGANRLQGFLQESWFLTAHPQVFHPFRESQTNTKLFLIYDNDKEKCYFAIKDDYGQPINRESILQIQHYELEDKELNNLWFKRDYISILETYVMKEDSSKYRISLEYGELSFVEYKDDDTYMYNDQFGLTKV